MLFEFGGLLGGLWLLWAKGGRFGDGLEASGVRPEAVLSDWAKAQDKRAQDSLDHSAFHGWNVPYDAKRISAVKSALGCRTTYIHRPVFLSFALTPIKVNGMRD